jgi:hypothetical protein
MAKYGKIVKSSYELKDQLHILKSTSAALYQVQHDRIAAGNRLINNVKRILGIDATIKVNSEDQKKESQKFLSALNKEYTQIHKVLGDAAMMQQIFKQNKIVRDEVIFDLAHSCYFRLDESEETLKSMLGDIVKLFPLYQEYLQDVCGCGTVLSGIFIAKFDPYKGKTPEAYLKYAGLDTVPHTDKSGNSITEVRTIKKKHHLVMRKYTNKSTGEVKEVPSITYDPFLKSKLWMLAECMIMQKGKGGLYDYYPYYRNKKTRMLEQQSAGLRYQDWTLKHIDNAARVYMKQVFVRDLQMVSRAMEGLPVTLPWHQRMVLGMTNFKDTRMEHHPSLIQPLLDKFNATYVEAYTADGRPILDA